MEEEKSEKMPEKLLILNAKKKRLQTEMEFMI